MIVTSLLKSMIGQQTGNKRASSPTNGTTSNNNNKNKENNIYIYKENFSM